MIENYTYPNGLKLLSSWQSGDPKGRETMREIFDFTAFILSITILLFVLSFILLLNLIKCHVPAGLFYLKWELRYFLMI